MWAGRGPIAWGKFLNAGADLRGSGPRLGSGGMARSRWTRPGPADHPLLRREPLAGEDLPDIVNRRHFERLAGLLSGRRIAMGGQTDPEGLRIAPRCWWTCRRTARCWRRRSSAPSCPCCPTGPAGAGGGPEAEAPPAGPLLFTRSRSVERRCWRPCPSGGGCVNDTVVHLADPRLPFGGVGNSGMGACHGKAGFDAFTHEKAYSKRAAGHSVRYPPYGKKHLGILKKLM